MSEKRAGYTTRRFHDTLDDVLDRPVAYNPAFKKITGSTVAALMLSQAFYWSKRTSDDDGWFYKTIDEWEDETGLTRSEQETARKHLKRFMEVELRGIPAQLYYRVVKDEIHAALGVQFAETPQTSLPQPSKQGGDIPANINRYAETTTENTSPKPDLLDGILKYELHPKAIQDALKEHFKLTPNWAAKYNKEFMEWAVEIKMTPEQVKYAAEKWRTDRRFSWQQPNLRTIQEQWLSLIDGMQTGPRAEPDADGGYRI